MKRKQGRYILFYTADLVLLFISFIIMAWYKQSNVSTYLSSHHIYFIILAFIWLLVSLVYGKVPGRDASNYKSFFLRIIVGNLISFGVTMIIMFGSGEISLSRIMVFGTVLLGTLFELFLGSIIFTFKRAQISDGIEDDRIKHLAAPTEYELVNKISGKSKNSSQPFKIDEDIFLPICNEIGEDRAREIIEMIGYKLTKETVVMSITNHFNIRTLPEKFYSYIINLHIINDIKQLDQFIDAVNLKLNEGGFFLYCVETKDQRKEKIMKGYPVVINYIIYIIDFICCRVFPKLRFSRPIYNFFSNGNGTVISRAEALGRVSRGGFEIIDEKFIGNYLFIETQKRSAPLPIKENMGSPLIALQRIGKGGKEIKVFKLRTMHPYSEYIQAYVYSQNNIQYGGKFKNDFRVTSWGAVCRKIWLDELPMIINFFKGDLKLVGVRPLSRHYFNLYDKEVQERRVRYKPGLIPPFYMDMPKDLEGIQVSEVRYLDRYDKHPFLTDFRYFFVSLWNILFHHARSK